MSDQLRELRQIKWLLLVLCSAYVLEMVCLGLGGSIPVRVVPSMPPHTPPAPTRGPINVDYPLPLAAAVASRRSASEPYRRFPVSSDNTARTGRVNRPVSEWVCLAARGPGWGPCQSVPASHRPIRVTSVSCLPLALGSVQPRCSAGAEPFRSRLSGEPTHVPLYTAFLAELGRWDQDVAGFRADRLPHPLPGETAIAERRFRFSGFAGGVCNTRRFLTCRFLVEEESNTAT